MIENSVLVIAKKEIMDNFRNKWIIVLCITFAIIAIFSSFFGSFGKGWSNFDDTMNFMIFFLQFLIPIIGLMIGYASIGKEVETGTMSSLISFPVTRFEIILGKFLGLGAVLSGSIFIGFLVAGFIIGINVPNADYGEYFIFIIESIILGLVFLSIAMAFSSFTKRRSTAMGASIFSWFFFSMIWGIMLLGIGFMVRDESGYLFPEWLYSLNIISPVASYVALIALKVDRIFTIATLSSDKDYFPSFYSDGILVMIMLIWILTMFILAYWAFNKRDI